MKWQQWRQFFFNIPYVPPTPPPPESFTDPLSIEVWNIIMAPRFDRAKWNGLMAREFPNLFNAWMQKIAERSGASTEFEYYS